MRTIVGSERASERPDLPHGHRELLATASCSPMDLGRLRRRWTSSCWLPEDTPLEILLDGRYGSSRHIAGSAEPVRAWFATELPRLRRAQLSLTIDVRNPQPRVSLQADGLGTVVLPGWSGCSGPSDAARAISRLATRRRLGTEGSCARPAPIDPVVRAAHALLCEEHLVRSIRTVFPADSRLRAITELHHRNRTAYEQATAASVLWLARLVIFSEAPEPTVEHLTWFRQACNVRWSDEHIIGLWRSFPELATRINGATLSAHLLHRAGGNAGEALATIDHLSATGDVDAVAATIAEAAGWARLRRQDGRPAA